MPDFTRTYPRVARPEETPALRQALRLYAGLLEKARPLGSAAVLGVMAELGRRDLFFLLTRLLGRKDAENEFVFRRCREVQAGPDGYRNPAYLLCTDPDLPVERLLQAYLWRWEIELNFRDEKT
ncbi:MAG: hypothetical protein LBQ63_07950, partial [Deltaproteobacteria bacterium]|nr:hypothetical protein [Deltaproteobacteria bacterium]